MIEVISVKFKNRGKCYFFAPNGLSVRTGDRVIVETAKGLEIADCCHGNHMAEDNAVVQPLRGVVRLATTDDLRVAEINKKREKEAFGICEKKIAEHGLDMKLVDVECNFEGNKTTFFFTSNGRVDFRELVKDLAGIFRNRIELRQIGVRDETKMLGGIGICGRPFCCSQFLEDFQPVSTKMAKIQSLSLNPAKISGACGRLMCCLRYEQAAYEDLVKKVPKQGAFVETIDGYGTAVQVNLLRQTVKVRLDSDTDDSLHLYKANELCAVPGGRPRDGEEPPHVLHYVPEEPEELEEEETDSWVVPTMVVPEPVLPAAESGERRSDKSRRKRRKGGDKSQGEKKPAEKKEAPAKKEAPVKKEAPAKKPEKGESKNARPAGSQKKNPKSGTATVKPVKLEPKPKNADPAASGQNPAEKRSGRPNHRRRPRGGRPKTGAAE